MRSTLGNFLKNSVGRVVTIELHDETALEGALYTCDPKTLNIELSDVTLYRRRIRDTKAVQLTTFFVKGRHIRFIHFDSYSQVVRILKRSFRKKR